MPVPVPATPPPAVAATAQTRAERAIVAQINRVRRSHGLRAVRIDGRLARVARAHSRSMLRHDVLTHGAFTVRLRRAGAQRHFGETLAWTPGHSGTARAVVSMWMQSAEHRVVLMDGGMRRIGIGRRLGAMGAQRGAAITADFSA